MWVDKGLKKDRLNQKVPMWKWKVKSGIYVALLDRLFYLRLRVRKGCT